MKKIAAALLLAAVFVFLIITISGWLRLENKRTEAANSFQALVDFYVSMDKEHIAPLQQLSSLGDDEKGALAQYGAALAAANGDESLAARIERLRTAQRTAFAIFESATGSLSVYPAYVIWHRDSLDTGKAYPMILTYNQAAKSLNDELVTWPSSMVAAVLGIEPLVLIDVNGEPFQQRPSRI